MCRSLFHKNNYFVDSADQRRNFCFRTTLHIYDNFVSIPHSSSNRMNDKEKGTTSTDFCCFGHIRYVLINSFFICQNTSLTIADRALKNFSEIRTPTLCTYLHITGFTLVHHYYSSIRPQGSRSSTSHGILRRQTPKFLYS